MKYADTTPETRVTEALVKACEDNNTDDPTQEQFFHASLELSALEPNDARWNMLNATLIYDLR